MLLVVTGDGWSTIIYDFADKFGSMLNSMLFFHSFYLLIKCIVLSLLTGLIWEIFTIISNNLGKKKESGIIKNPDNHMTEESEHFDSEDEASLDDKFDPESLIHPSDEDIVFIRQKLKEAKKDNLRDNEITILRDDYSFAKMENSIRIQGQE